MLNIEATIRWKGYNPNDLKPQSNKKVWANCDNCGKGRWVTYQQYYDLCYSCATPGMRGKKHSKETIKRMCNAKKHISKETRKKIGDANKKRIFSDETRRKMSAASSNISEETRRKISVALKGKKHSEETRMKMSAGQQNIPYEDWEGFARDNPYCPAFNEACKESNRDKYDRECFICGLSESENKTSTNKSNKLSVHHIDMDKTQGCDGKRWKLIPVCIHCHNKIHTKLWTCRIIYLLNDTIQWNEGKKQELKERQRHNLMD